MWERTVTMGKVVELEPLTSPVYISNRLWDVQHYVDAAYGSVDLAASFSCNENDDTINPESVKAFLNLIGEQLRIVKEGLEEIQEQIHIEKPARNTRKKKSR